MNKEEAKQYIQNNTKDYLQPDRTKKGYICPICGSGSGNKGTGITTRDKVHFTCWAGCFTNSDIIDIIGQEYGLTDYDDKLQKAADIFNITMDRGYNKMDTRKDDISASENQKQNEIKRNKQLNFCVNTSTDTQAEEEQDYTNFFLQANKDIEKTSYHRGLTLETLNRYKVGYIENWRNPKAPNAPASPRLIIPTSDYSYLARDTRTELTKEQQKYNKIKVGKVRIFNSRALGEAKKPIFVVEGELDALSIIDVGGEAIALGSTANKKAFLTMLESQKPSSPLIIAMDNDEAGSRANKELTEGLERLNVPFYEIDIVQSDKDANEALNRNREAFRTAVGQAMKQVESIEAETLRAEKEQLKKEAVVYSLQDFINNITKSKRADFFSTGFSSLDSILDGGLYSGLYVVGAISSLGKTTFCLQIADQVASLGQDVLIFSLEMAKDELISKSVSRFTLIKDLEENGSTAHAKTTKGILAGSRYAQYSEIEKKLIQEALTAYGEYAANIYIIEREGSIGIEEIRDRVRKHIKLTGKAPVVVIDYLQIIAPADIRATDKQNTDKAVSELKRLSRYYSIPVIGISSFNRDNYISPVNLASFKESGAIEYSSDVLIGLQYEGMDYREGEQDKDRQKRIREIIKISAEKGRSGQAQSIQVKVLKNRNGSKGDTFLDFYPMFNYFTEKGEVVGHSEGRWNRSESCYRR